jgi:hypothetical protein
MKRFAAFALALALFAAPVVSMAADNIVLSDVFNQYEKTILFDTGG